MAANELFGKANEEFVNENYQKALELYTNAIKNNDAIDDYYCNRAQVHLKLENYEDAISDANKACDLNPKNSKAFFRKGVALFHQQKYKEAKETFLDSQILEGENSNNKTWIRKCEAELDLSAQNPVESSEPKVGVSTGEQSINTKSNADSQSESASLSSSNQAPAIPTPQKVKHDWYQTQTHVVVTVLLKNVKKENMQSEIHEKSLSVSVKLPQGSEYNLDIDLAYNVVPEKSITKILSSKIEIKLKKSEERQWTKLDDDGEKQSEVKQFKPEESDEQAKQYPTSSHYTRNWDKLVDDIKQEEKDEKLEGDAALNQLFQKIYADGTDETKKAMMKSFYESGGTVLSTNWKEVGDEKVDVKPPDGMEYKKWEY